MDVARDYTTRPMNHAHPVARPAVLGLLAVLAVLAVGGCARPGEVVEACHDTPNRESNCSRYRSDWEPEWKEAEAVLPPLPRAADLVPLDAHNGAPGYDYQVDRTSVKRGSDGVMRYTVVVRSATGAVNTFLEGMRCLTGEVRTYAYASGDAAEFRRLDDDWGPVAARGSRGYQDFLYSAIMCDRHGYAWPEERVVDALTSQYTAGGVRIERFCGNLQDCSPTGSRF